MELERTGAARRREERRLRSLAKHEVSIAMALAENLRPTGTHDGQCKRGKGVQKNAMYEAPRGQKTPLPEKRQ